MEIVHIILTSLGSIIALFLLTKLMGDRQMSQMSLFDYINGITIGSIAAEFATSLEGDFVKPLTAMIVYALVAVFIAFITCKSMALRRFFNGKPLVLYEHGRIYKKNLLSAKLDINEFLTQCRVAGWFNLDDLEAVVLETSGQLSFLPTATAHPLTGADTGITPPAQKLPVAVVIDGKIIPDNLQSTGRDEKWLQSQLHAQQLTDLTKVFFAMVDTEGNRCAYVLNNEKKTHNCFE